MSHEPIQTTYAGYRFRSRLEARWAVFLDALGLKWEYEPQGFVTLVRPYLPDFHLPDLGCYLEIKPDAPAHGSDEIATAFAFVLAAHAPIFHLYGVPGPWSRPEIRWEEHSNVRAIGFYRRQWPSESLDELARKLDGKLRHESGFLAARQAICELAKLPEDSLLEHAHCPDATCDWLQCLSCGRLGLGPPGGNAARAFCKCAVPDWRPDTDKLLAAYQRARSARFEHDERWRP